MNESPIRPETAPSIWKRALPAGVLLALVALVFGRVTDHRLLLTGDAAVILENELVQQGPSGVLRNWAAPPRADGDQPLARLAHAVVVGWGGGTAATHHATSLALHGLLAVLVLVLLSRAGVAHGPSIFVAAAFALHPLVLEPIAWAALLGRVLAGVLVAASLLVLLARERRPGPVPTIIGLVLFALALLAHPSAAGLALFLMIVGARRPGARGGPLAFALLAGAVCARALLTASSADPSFGQRLLAAPLAAGSIVLRIVLPFDLAYVVPNPEAQGALVGAWLVVVPAALLVSVLVRRAGVPSALRLGWTWFLALLVPALLLPHGPSLGPDRVAYLALPGFLVALAGVAPLLARARGARRLLPLAGGALLLAWSATTWSLVETWRDQRSLTARALVVSESNPVAHTDRAADLFWRGKLTAAAEEAGRALELGASARAHHLLGAMALRREDPSAARRPRLDEALEHLERALAADPDHVESLILAGRVLHLSGARENLIPAAEHLRRAVRLAPYLVHARVELGKLLISMMDVEGARDHLLRAVAIDPVNSPEAWWGLGLVEWQLGRPAEATRHLERALEIEPDSVDALVYLGRVQLSGGDARGALAVLSRATEIHPRKVDANFHRAEAHAALGQDAQAQEYFERTLTLNRRHTRANVALARIYVDQGRLEEARFLVDVVLERNPAHPGASELARALDAGRND